MTDDLHVYLPDAVERVLPARGNVVREAEHVDTKIVDDLPAAAVTAAADALRTITPTDDEIARAVLHAAIKPLALKRTQGVAG